MSCYIVIKKRHYNMLSISVMTRCLHSVSLCLLLSLARGLQRIAVKRNNKKQKYMNANNMTFKAQERLQEAFLIAQRDGNQAVEPTIRWPSSC